MTVKYIPTFIRPVSVGKKSFEVKEKPGLVFHATSINIDLFTSTLSTECGKKHVAV